MKILVKLCGFDSFCQDFICNIDGVVLVIKGMCVEVVILLMEVSKLMLGVVWLK